MGLLQHLRRHRRVSLFSPSSPSLVSRNLNLLSPHIVVSNRNRRLWPTGRLPPYLSNPNFTCFSSSLFFRPFSWHAPSTGSNSVSHGDVDLTEGSQTVSELSNLGVDGSEVVEAVDVESLWYAPVHAVISLLDGYHDLTCLPWWIIIASSTLALRLSLLPVLLLQFKKVGKLSKLFPKLPPPLPPPFSGMSFREQFLLFRKKKKELGCPSYLWSFAYVIVQIPCFLLWMTSIRRMCLDNHPGFDSGGTLWFQNLTEFSQGILGAVFPLLIASLHYINVQVSFQTFDVKKLPGVFGLLARYYKLYLDILAIPLLVIGFYVPQGSLVYWVTNSSLTLVQQLCLRNSYVRIKLGLPKVVAMTEAKISMDMDAKKVAVEHQVSTENRSPQELLELALKYLATNNQDGAVPLLRLATEKDPELVRALIAMGQVLCSRGLLVEAAEYFERAISKTRENEEVGLLILALFGAGVSHIGQGKKSEGIKHLKRIAELKEPESPINKACYYRGLVMLGSTLFKEGKKSEAAKYLRMAAAYDPAVNAYVRECEEG